LLYGIELTQILTRVSSVLFGCFFRPERRLNGACFLVPEVGQYPGPIKDASLCSRLSKLRRTEFAFGIAHSPAQDWIELWCIAHPGLKAE
jgi:hypothetical protein